jgi:prepilin-type N-terminal cleavage/methylation domain-containing protein
MKNNKGFTLIELLVVIAIIGILASVILASLNSARSKANDARRKSDLAQIATALQLYRDANGTFVISGSGASGGGNGWFSLKNGTNYALSVAEGLANSGFIGGIVVDPSGQTSSNGVSRSGYMIYADADHYTLWANLENPTPADIATMNNCYSNAYDNYSLSAPAKAQMNYCIGN